MIQITPVSLSLPEEADLKKLALNFRQNRYLLLPGFLEASLARSLDAISRTASFVSAAHKGVGNDETMGKSLSWNTLEILLNDPNLFVVIQKLTGISPIHFFNGRIYRLNPEVDQSLCWHDDADGNRQVALTINLSPQPYAGGILKIRDAESRQIIAELQNSGFGDAVLFEISESLEHCVTPVKGMVPRVAFAGWFERDPGRVDCLSLPRLTVKKASDG